MRLLHRIRITKNAMCVGLAAIMISGAFVFGLTLRSAPAPIFKDEAARLEVTADDGTYVHVKRLSEQPQQIEPQRTEASPHNSAKKNESWGGAPEQRVREPHPITSEYVLMQAKNALSAAMADAVFARNVTELQKLIQEHRERFPEDTEKTREGYEIMARCLMHGDSETRELAQHFYDSERASTLRRTIRRVCLEGA